MMEAFYQFILQAVALIVAMGATYGAIRSDLKHLHELSESNKELALSAHRKVDSHLHDHLAGFLAGARKAGD